MTLFGVRPRVWLSAAGFGAAALALWFTAAPRERSDPAVELAQPSAGRPERAAAAVAGRGTRIRVGARELGGAAADARARFEAPIVNVERNEHPHSNGHAAAGSSAASAGGVLAAAAAEPGASPAELAAAHLWRRRSPPEVASLERDVVRSLSGLPREDAAALEAVAVADLETLEPAPGESPDAFEERREDALASATSDEVLLRARLGELYAQQVYPHDFDPERDVVPMERQLIRALPPADRSAALRQVVDAGLPGPPQPVFQAPGASLSQSDPADL